MYCAKNNLLFFHFALDLKNMEMFRDEYLCKAACVISTSCVFWRGFVYQSVLSLACEYCLRALETAEENARRLSGLPALGLPHPELCKVRPELHVACPSCQVHYTSLKLIQKPLSARSHHGFFYFISYSCIFRSCLS